MALPQIKTSGTPLAESVILNRLITDANGWNQTVELVNKGAVDLAAVREKLDELLVTIEAEAGRLVGAGTIMKEHGMDQSKEEEKGLTEHAADLLNLVREARASLVTG